MFKNGETKLVCSLQGKMIISNDYGKIKALIIKFT